MDMKNFGRFILDRNFIFLGALLLGLLFPGGAPFLLPLLFPALALVIMISMLSIGPEVFRSPKVVFKHALIGIGVNYLVMTGVILAAGRLLISDPALRTGFILMAAIPPAVAVIPFTEMLGGNRTASLFGTVGGFFSAFLLLPLITLIFIGTDIVEPSRLFLILTGLIIVPFVFSRLLRGLHLDAAVEPYKGPVTNLCFGTVFYIMVAANHHIIVHQTSVLVLLIAVGLLIMAVSAAIVLTAARLLSADPRTRISLLLLATLKNYAVSAGLGLVLFSDRAALPSVIMTVIMVPYILLLGFFIGRRKRKGTPY
ncbi:MAG: bile acid:sodium symporter [Deltaproteobacteria bacterium]|nr:bile acid:sodium symporter [Candidatus Zymogenaceae bacterium]